MSEWERHRDHAEAKAKTAANDGYAIAEQIAGWVHTAQCDKAILDAAIDMRRAARRMRNLLNPDVTFPDERGRIFNEL